MTRFHTMHRHSNCCAAAASSFARISGIMDTVLLAVSIFVCLQVLRF